MASSEARFILLKKSPRSVIETTALLRSVHALGRHLEVLHLQLPGDTVSLSTKRQLELGPTLGRMPESAEHRALVHLWRSSSGRETLRFRGLPIHAVERRAQRQRTRRRRQYLGLGPEALRWPLGTLETIERVAKRLQIEGGWTGSGAVYRSFWNERFGPAKQPTDVDVSDDDKRAVVPRLNALDGKAPGLRWSVLCPATKPHCAAEAKSFATFSHRQGLVRVNDGRIGLQLPEGAEACLRNGVIALNPKILEAFKAPDRAPAGARNASTVLRTEERPSAFRPPTRQPDGSLLHDAPQPRGLTSRCVGVSTKPEQAK